MLPFPQVLVYLKEKTEVVVNGKEFVCEDCFEMLMPGSMSIDGVRTQVPPAARGTKRGTLTVRVFADVSGNLTQGGGVFTYDPSAVDGETKKSGRFKRVTDPLKRDGCHVRIRGDTIESICVHGDLRFEGNIKGNCTIEKSKVVDITV